MSSRGRRPVRPGSFRSPRSAFQSPVADEPEGTEFYEQMLATHRLLHEGSKNSCAYIYNLFDDPSAPGNCQTGTKAEEPKIATSPPQGGAEPFSNCVTSYRYPGVAEKVLLFGVAMDNFSS